MKNNQKFMPLFLQLFADEGNGEGTQATQNGVQNNSQETTQQLSIDYDKIQSMIDSRNSKTEEAVLKSYFQSQGMSKEEMEQAIGTFKSQKEQNSKQQVIDNNTLKEQLANANKATLRSNIEKEAIMQALELGIDSKTIPYVSKLADFSKVVDEQGNINNELIKTALQQVLDDVPALKTKSENAADLKVGADGSDTKNSSGELFNFGFTGVRKH